MQHTNINLESKKQQKKTSKEKRNKGGIIMSNAHMRTNTKTMKIIEERQKKKMHLS